MVFKHQKSGKAVTTKVKIAKIGNLTLIDTPGTNDPDKKRTDVNIQIEFINTIRTTLLNKEIGINTFTQCIMPDAGGRIRRTSIDSMCNILLSLSSFYEDADLYTHPRMCVVFNNVSKRTYPKKVIAPYRNPNSIVNVSEEQGSCDQEESDDGQDEVTWDKYVEIYK